MGKRAAKPLDEAALTELALAYVGRYATTRVKATRYLRGKLRVRGWAGAGEPPVDAIVERLAASGAINDASFGEMRAGSLARRGYGPRRVAQALAAAGVEEELRSGLTSEMDAVAAAEAYARRRRLGRFAGRERSPEEARRDMAAMLRAGHGWEVARKALGRYDDETGFDAED